MAFVRLKRRRGVMAWSLGMLAVLMGGCGDSAPPPTTEPGDDWLPAEAFDCRAPAPAEGGVNRCLTDPSCEERMVVGHRGMGGTVAPYAPENSLSAIRLAILLGVDAVEIDVRATLDDKVVVMHDGSTSRTTGADLEVSETTLDDLVGLPLSADEFLGDFSCERVSTFAEVLELARGRINLIVDTKTSRGDLVAIEIRDADMVAHAYVSTSSPATAVAARDAVPEIQVQVRPATVPEYDEMALLFSRPPEILEVPVTELSAFLPVAAATDARLFADVFVQDGAVLLSGDISFYEEPFALGAQIVQSEFPMWVLDHLGRGSQLPQHRDFAVESPLFP